MLLATLAGVAVCTHPAQARGAAKSVSSTTVEVPHTSRWTEAEARAWSDLQPWLVGANYVPAYAINQLEMWQANTFSPADIDRELGWAKASGMNAMRVFLHDLLWQENPKAFKARIDTFLAIADRHQIKIAFVLFDSVWDPNPRLGPQHPPIPGVHNSGWVQGPGWNAAEDARQHPRLEAYVKDIVGTYGRDQRVIFWDLWNEPNGGAEPEKFAGRETLVANLLSQVFGWARAARPLQPLTSGVWGDGNWIGDGERSPIVVVQLDQSDIISFHDYNWPERFEASVKALGELGRPLFCTEYLARGAGSTFDGSLPVGKAHNVGMFHWGLVDGKTQTRLPWDSWELPYVKRQPAVWHHEVLRATGEPYRQAEIDLIRRLAKLPKGMVRDPKDDADEGSIAR